MKEGPPDHAPGDPAPGHLAFVAAWFLAANPARAGRISVGQAALEAQREAGDPALSVARDGVETFFYGNRKRTLSLSFLDGRVIAYDDRAAWPADVEVASKRAHRSASRGAVRVGLTEVQVVEALGPPAGVTGYEGRETLHWPNSDEQDTIVDLRNGRVVGYADLEVDRFAQNVPRLQRDKSTTDGRVRLGQARGAVESVLGPPDGVSAREASLTQRYESHPAVGHDVTYFVQYDSDRVTGFWQEDLWLAKKQRAVERREAKRAVAEEREKARAARDVGAGRAVFGFLMSAAVQTALQAQAASVKSAPASRPGGEVERPAAPPPSQASTCSCPELTCKVGSVKARVQSCRSTCATPVCTCTGLCEEGRGALRDHRCRCD